MGRKYTKPTTTFGRRWIIKAAMLAPIAAFFLAANAQAGSIIRLSGGNVGKNKYTIGTDPHGGIWVNLKCVTHKGAKISGPYRVEIKFSKKKRFNTVRLSGGDGKSNEYSKSDVGTVSGVTVYIP